MRYSTKLLHRYWRQSWMLFCMLFIMALPAAAQDAAPLVLVLDANGPVTPAMAQYLERGLQTAEQRGADLVILRLHTPGGTLETMNRIVQDIRASRIAVVVYVSPAGAMAGSAGTLITLAGHAAAMAPETIIGAASPVGGEGEDLDATMAAKYKNATQATVRSLAVRRSPEAVALAEETISSARAVSSKEAVQVGLVDFMAPDLSSLLEQLDGFTVYMEGQPILLETTNAQVVPLPLSLIEQLLQTLTNPNIVFLLLSIGVQAVLIEISSPGGWVAGFIGVVCLALATYGLGLLPVNWFGLIFLVTAFALFVLDIKAPTHGALTAAGAASLVVGALVLFNSSMMPRFMHISPVLIVAVSALTAGLFALILSFAIRAQTSPILTGQESLAGRVGVVRTDISPKGTVQVGGELWTAELLEGQLPLMTGTRVKVEKTEGLKLRVTPLHADPTRE